MINPEAPAIPAYWSFDPKRDIRWDAIASLLLFRIHGRQVYALPDTHCAPARTSVRTLIDDHKGRLSPFAMTPTWFGCFDRRLR